MGSVRITVLLYYGLLLCGFNVVIKGLKVLAVKWASHILLLWGLYASFIGY